MEDNIDKIEESGSKQEDGLKGDPVGNNDQVQSSLIKKDPTENVGDPNNQNINKVISNNINARINKIIPVNTSLYEQNFLTSDF